MNNKENYKNAMNEIHASEELKHKTFEKVKNKSGKKIVYLRYLTAAVAVFIICFAFFENMNKEEQQIIAESKDETHVAIKNDLPRFENIDELKAVLQESVGVTKGRGIIEKSAAINEEMAITDSISNEAKQSENVEDFSKTNVQVENVDEADIVKTDGEYIYYVTSDNIYIVAAEELNVIAKIGYDSNEKQMFSPSEIYINNNKLIVLGNYYEYQTDNIQMSTDEMLRDYVSVRNMTAAKAIVYDISNKQNPNMVREVSLDGYYINSRMIGNNIYFISEKHLYYYDGIKDEEILPLARDSVTGNENKIINCTDIAYFKGTNNYSYMLVGGFNIENNEEVNIETFFGASSEIYASENNLYITQIDYGDNYNSLDIKTIIYKFNLDNSNVILQCKGEVQGTLKNQFSMDEYDGNLRVATTYTLKDDTQREVDEEKETIIISIDNEKVEANRLYVLDKDLKEIGRIDNLAEGESIYAVRFIGRIGYIVTFEQIDPLFVIDLSDPTNPQVKGELKIPGYSSYLHPYDENHIIGIGYNTKDNGYGGITNSNMKMSMFDVSNLENPQEIFSVDIGEKDYTYSQITNNHKALFYHKERNLIGFPIMTIGENYKYNKSGFIIYKINLDSGFEKYGEILTENNYKTNVERVIYIKDMLYTISNNDIISYDLNTIEKKKDIVFDK